MTEEMPKMTKIKCKTGNKKEKKPTKSFFASAFFGYAAVFMLLLFLKRPEDTAAWVLRGLDICVRRLIPSVFPFMVVSSLLVSSGAGERIGRIFRAPLRRLFGVGEQGGVALIMGWICGFPIGARTASELCQDGKISRSELERIIVASGVPSPAFLINTVGAVMLGEARRGILLYAVCVLSSAAVGFAMSRGKRAEKKYSPPTAFDEKKTGRGATSGFIRAVTDSAEGMLRVCGFVVFFSAFVGALEGLVGSILGEGWFADLIFGFFEITVGLTRVSSSSLSPRATLVAAAAVAAWSGLSVHLQVISLSQDCGVSLPKYFAANFIKATVGALLMLGALSILNIL